MKLGKTDANDYAAIDLTAAPDLDISAGLLYKEEAAMAKAERDRKHFESRRIKLLLQKEEIYCKAAAHFEEFVELPAPGVQFRVVTEQAFNPYTLIKRITKDADIEEMYMSTYSMNETAVEGLIEMIKADYIKEAWFIISLIFRKYKDTESHAQYYRLANFCKDHPDRIHYCYLWSHAKVFVVKDSKGNHYVMEGSMNLSGNSKIEQFMLENRRETYEFHRDWIRQEIIQNEENQ